MTAKEAVADMHEQCDSKRLKVVNSSNYSNLYKSRKTISNGGNSTNDNGICSISETPMKAIGQQPKEIPSTTTSVRKEPRHTQQRPKILQQGEELEPEGRKK